MVLAVDDILNIMECYIQDTKPIGLYISSKRYPLAKDLRYLDNTKVDINDLREEDIYHDNEIVIVADAIKFGMVSTKPSMHVELASLLEDILYAFIYFKQSDRDIIYTDPLELSDYPLIPINVVGRDLNEATYFLIRDYILNGTDSTLTDKEYDNAEQLTNRLMREFRSNRHIQLIKSDTIYSIDSDSRVFELTELGNPYELRYQYGLVNRRRQWT